MNPQDVALGPLVRGGVGSAELMVELNYLKGFFQPKQLHGSTNSTRIWKGRIPEMFWPRVQALGALGTWQ